MLFREKYGGLFTFDVCPYEIDGICTLHERICRVSKMVSPVLKTVGSFS